MSDRRSERDLSEKPTGGVMSQRACPLATRTRESYPIKSWVLRRAAGTRREEYRMLGELFDDSRIFCVALAT